MVTAPWSPTYAKPWGSAQDAQAFELKRLRLWNVSDTITASLGTGTGTGNVPDGVLAFRTTSSQRRLNFTDSGSDVIVPRVDYNETVSAQWGFTYNSGAPFTVTSTTKVTNLNADLLDGYNTSTTETADTVAVRTSLGRLKCADPSSGTDVVNYQSMVSYVSGVVQPHAAAKYTTTAALPSFTASGTPKVLTATANGALSVDGSTPSVGDRIGVVYETSTNQKYNGLYIVTTVGDGSNPWVLTRATDADTSAELPSGSQWWTTSGTANGGSSWILTTPDPITLDTTALTFVQNGGTQNITAGNGIDKTGNVVSVKINASTTYTAGAIVYADTTTTLNGAQLTGILKGNGSSAPTAVTGTANVITKWGTSGTTLTTSSLTDDGSSVTTSVNLTPSTDSARSLGTSSLAWLTTYTDQLLTTNGTGASTVYHQLFQTTGTRWSWGLKGTESGSNAGSNLTLTSYTDAGSASTEVLSVNRATGALTVMALTTTSINATSITNSALTNGKLVKAGSGGVLADSVLQESSSMVGVNGAATSPFHVIDSTTTSGGAPTGTTSNIGFNVGASAVNTVVNIGIDATGTAYGWIQARSKAAASYNPLVLQPGGGNVGIGTTSTVSAKLHVLSTSAQAMFAYDGSNTATFTVGSTGILTIAPTGASGVMGVLSGGWTVFKTGLNGLGVINAFDVYSDGRTAGDTLQHGTYLQNTATAKKLYSCTRTVIVTATAGSEDGEFQVWTIGAGTTAQRTVVTKSGDFGVGVTAPSARIHGVSTTEQGRFGYDSGKYFSVTVSSAGATTLSNVTSGQNLVLTTTGTSAVSVSGTTASSSTTTGSLINAGGFGNAGKAFFGDSVNVTTNNTQFTIGYDGTFKQTFVVSSTGEMVVSSNTGAKTATFTGASFTTVSTSTTASVNISALYASAQGSNTQGTNYGFRSEAANGLTSVAGLFTAGFSSGTSSTGIHGIAFKLTGGSETDVYAVKGEVQMGSASSSTTGSSFYALSAISSNFTSYVGFNFAPAFTSSPTGTTVYGAKLNSVISGATVATNYALYVNATGGTANYAIYIAAGNVNFNALTASTILMLDSSKNVTSSTDLPAGITLGGLGISRKIQGSITWSLSGAEYICDITTGLGSDDVIVEVYDGSANKATWLFEVRRPSSGVVRIVSDVNLGSGYRYVIHG